MKRKLFCWMLICLPFAGISQSVKKIFISNNQVEIGLPAELETNNNLSEENKLVFTDKSNTIKFTIVFSNENVTDNDIPGYTDLAITSIKKESPTSKIYDDGISLNAGKNIGYVKYNYLNKNESPFEYVFYGSLNEKLLTFYFFCKPSDQAKWEKKMDTVVASLRINDKITP